MAVNQGRLQRAIYLPAFGPFGDPRVLVDLAIRAETAGWDGVFLWDHVVSDAAPVTDCWVSLSAMATSTETIRIGSTVTPLPRRRPWILARQASAVSRLSHGRVIVGVGLGSDESGDFSRFGEEIDLSTRSSMLGEGLDIVRAMWDGSAHVGAGEHYRVDIPSTAPEPYPIPVWMASSTRHRRVLERAVRCDGIFSISDHTFRPEEVASIVEALRDMGLAPEAPYDVAVSGNASSAWERPNPDGVDLAAIAEAGATWWMESLMHFDPLDLSLRVVDAGPP